MFKDVTTQSIFNYVPFISFVKDSSTELKIEFLSFYYRIPLLFCHEQYDIYIYFEKLDNAIRYKEQISSYYTHCYIYTFFICLPIVNFDTYLQ